MDINQGYRGYPSYNWLDKILLSLLWIVGIVGPIAILIWVISKVV